MKESDSKTTAARDWLEQGVNAGLPPLVFKEKTTSFFEFWPVWLMYVPVAVYWLYLSIRYRSLGLPLLANPHIPLGGMIGESKKDIFNQAAPALFKTILPFIVVKPDSDLGNKQSAVIIRHASVAGIDLPFVIKPDMGCRGSGVSLIQTESQLQEYLENVIPSHELMVQKLAPYAAEAGIFYVRNPSDKKGKIVSLALKYRPVIVGDGCSTIKQLIYAHPRAHKLAKRHCEKNKTNLDQVLACGEEWSLEFAGSHCRGSIFRNGNVYISEPLTQAIDSLMQGLPEFYYGRLDVKFRNITQLERGIDFSIIEINGVSSEQAHIWDSNTRFRDALGTLLVQYKTLFCIGDQLRTRGYKVPSVWAMLSIWVGELKRGS
ncbi:ATP-grasp domain-containing protein [Teredinibacter purpureus]|uniref:ATP-grasp domain-containing protein n=1 Tax=Teredinibacter purpureus TaxID=2731756 RepID=UPI0005F812F5|nr:ATP-grasp domain-containing protein [Teredinibacter purpureus]